MEPTILLSSEWSAVARVSAPRLAGSARPAATHHRRLAAALWTVQTVLALLFLFAGGMKLVMPVEALAQQSPLPGAFLQFIGVAEVLGALGLVLPGLFRVRTHLTPLAAVGLVIIMIGATVVTAATGPVSGAVVPAIVGCLAAFVAYGRSRLVPHRERSRAAVVQHAA